MGDNRICEVVVMLEGALAMIEESLERGYATSHTFGEMRTTLDDALYYLRHSHGGIDCPNKREEEA